MASIERDVRVQNTNVISMDFTRRRETADVAVDRSLRTYPFRYQWKRALTDLDTKKKQRAKRPGPIPHFDVIHKLEEPTLFQELGQFELYGNLRSATTEIHNPLPTPGIIHRELRFDAFDVERRTHPHSVSYKDFDKAERVLPSLTAPI